MSNRKIGIIADIHSLKEPLEAVLKDMKKNNIEEIYSLGDNIGLGPNPKEVMDLLDEYNVISIAGNNEEYLNIGVDPFWYLDDMKKETVLFTKRNLTKSQIEKIKTYPRFIEINLEGQKIALCHFANDVRCDFEEHSTWSYQKSPNTSYNQFAYTNSPSQFDLFAYKLNCFSDEFYSIIDSKEKLEFLREVIKNNKFSRLKNGIISYIENPLFYSDNKLKTVSDYDAIIQGHVHFESHVLTDNTNYHTLRALAIGDKTRKNDWALYYILSSNNGKYNLEKKEVSFDKKAMIKKIENTNFPNSKIKRYVGVK